MNVPDEAGQRRDDGAARADDPGALSRLLQEIALAPADDVVASWKEQLRPGARVGRFEIRGEIGRGGFGSVYEATDPELGRNVALEALRPHRTGRELSAEWIKKEAEAVAKLNHPNIVTLFDVGRCTAGPYLVMELLRGEGDALEELLSDLPLCAADRDHWSRVGRLRGTLAAPCSPRTASSRGWRGTSRCASPNPPARAARPHAPTSRSGACDLDLGNSIR